MEFNGILTVSYIIATILFILALGGLSHQETARRGNWYGIIGMAIALIATIWGIVTQAYVELIIALLIGGTVGLIAAKRVQMTQMPELVAILHSLVGLAAVAVGFANFLDPGRLAHYSGIDLTIHDIETYIGILIGAVTFSGSVIAFGKLSGKMSGNPLTLPGRHWLNLTLLLVVIYYGYQFVVQSPTGTADNPAGWMPLIIMTALSLLFGIHMVMAIGGADMPVVVSMLNSYSGWAASATGFMLGNDLLIVTGALVGSSGAILSYIMCRAMNRKFLAVIAGGFGTGGGTAAAGGGDQGEVFPIEPEETAELLHRRADAVGIELHGTQVELLGLVGRVAHRGEAHESRQGREPELVHHLLAHHQDGGRAVGDLRRVARRDDAVLFEGRPERGQRLDGRSGAKALIGPQRGDDPISLHLDGDDLVVEATLLGRPHRTLLGLRSDGVDVGA